MGSLTQTDLAELDRAIHRFGEAWACGDVAVLEVLLSPTYTHIDIYGALHDRASWLAYAERRAGRATRIGFRDVQTRLVGHTAIVTGINDIAGMGDQLATAHQDSTLRFTQVWTWREGRWLREAFQATIVAAK